MCGRLVVHVKETDLAVLVEEPVDAEVRASLQPRYNVAPGTGLVAVLEDRDRDSVRRASVLQWGLIPGWAKHPSPAQAQINARAESIADKPTFSDAFRYRRCIVPVNGFYEWDRRQRPPWPYFFQSPDKQLLLLAGIWEYWLHPSGSEIYSVALVTTAANSTMANIHHRMPLVLDPQGALAWLNSANANPDIHDFVPGESAPSPFAGHPVSEAVNRATIDRADLINPVTPPSQPQQLDLFG